MDGPLFDAMLKTALEEALRQDAGNDAPKPSAVHRQRMRRMLRGPRRVRPARWLAAALLAALLTGTAAGYALGGGALFRQMFQESPWAAVYGGAADTDQLIGLGGQLDTVVVESDGLRFEMQDAVSDGQMAMVSVRLTVLEGVEALLEDPGRMEFRSCDILPAEDAHSISSYGCSTRAWPYAPGLEEGQYQLLFTINDADLAQGGQYLIRLSDLCASDMDAEQGRTLLLPGTWTLAVTLQPNEVRTVCPDQRCRIDGAEWLLERVAVSPLALTMEFRCLEPVDRLGLHLLEDVAVHLWDGRTITREDCSTGISSSSERLDLTMEFQMPLDTAQVRSVSVCGQEILL